MFDVRSNTGVVSIGIPNSGWVDAAVSGTLAGAEFSVNGYHAFDTTPGENRRAKCVVDLTFAGGKEHMRVFALALLEKSGAPGFTDPEWREIADALRETKRWKYAQRIDAAL